MRDGYEHHYAPNRGFLFGRFILSVFLFISIAAPHARGGTCSGTILYTDRLYDTDLDRFAGTRVLPTRYVDVFLYTSDYSTLLGDGETDGNGNFSFPTTSMGVTDVRLVVAADSDNSPWTERLVVYDDDFSPSVQSVASAAEFKDTDTAFTFDYTIPHISGSSRTGDPFNVIDVLLSSAEQVFLQTDTKALATKVYWKDGSDENTRYVSWLNAIYLLGGTLGFPDDGDNDGYDDTVIIHEYGHFLADRYSKDDTPAGSHWFTDYFIPTLTWSEGWANFWPLAVRNSSVYWDATDGDGGFFIDLETGGSSFLGSEARCIGMNNEGAVGMVLYDIFDSADSDDSTPGVDDEGIAYGLANIWTVFNTYLDNPALLVTLLDMYQGWQALFSLEDVDAAYVGRKIEFVADAADSVFIRYPLELAIPDGSIAGVSDQLDISGFVGVITDVRVFVEVRHGSNWDLVVKVRHPDGTEVVVHNRQSSVTSNIIEWYGYPNYSQPAEPLSALAGKPFNGTWTITVTDDRAGNTGELKAWGLRFENAKPHQTGTGGPYWLID